MHCAVLQAARDQIVVAGARARMPVVRCFFDEPTNTASYVVHDPFTNRAAVIDSVLNFDFASGRTSTVSADTIVTYVHSAGLAVDWLLETHVHADHLSAGAYLKQRLGGELAIGRGVVSVQRVFGDIFNVGADFSRDGSEFDRLLDDGDRLAIGAVDAIALHVPGHTPADIAYVIGDAVFTGDTLLMPDYGTARADFPGGDAHQLYRSIRRLLSLPEETRLFLCHDYGAPGRDAYAWETTVGAQRRGNIHMRDGTTEEDFVLLREQRDGSLRMPTLILPSIQVNLRAGRLPDPEPNGGRYLKIPLDAF